MRKITREKVMKLLYTMDVYRQISKEVSLENYLATELGAELLEQQKRFLLNRKDDDEYFANTFEGVIEHLSEIDSKINQHTKKTWSIQQFGYVERSLLRIAIYELYWSEQEGLHPKVIISSIIELSEMFVDEKSVKFIHGILASAIQNITRVEEKPKKQNKYVPLDEGKVMRNKEQLRKFKEMKKKQKLDTK